MKRTPKLVQIGLYDPLNYRKRPRLLEPVLTLPEDRRTILIAIRGTNRALAKLEGAFCVGVFPARTKPARKAGAR